MTKLVCIFSSIGLLICAAFLFAFSWYAVSLRAQLAECSRAAAHLDSAAFEFRPVDGWALNNRELHDDPNQSPQLSI
jgi:hypothetical protein